MGVRRCIIAGCPSSSERKEDRGVSYHKIPANEEQKQRWWAVCRLPDNYVINKGSNLCSRHFRKADFQEFKGTKYLLKNGVVPTIFPWSVSGGGGGRKKKGGGKADAAKAEVAKSSVEVKEVVVKKEPEEEVGESSKEPEVVTEEPTEVKEEEGKKEEEVQVVKQDEVKEEVPILKEESLLTPMATTKKTTPASKKRSTPKRPPAKTPTSAPSSKKSRRSEPSTSNSTPKDRKSMQSPRKLNQSQITFTPGTKIEAQDFSGKWHPAKLGEVDTEEGEVLVQFEKPSGKSGKSAGLNDEWIPMDSVRLRPFQAQPKTPVGKTRFVVGEKCFARWSDSRKFKATIQAVLDNDMYEVLFDDGFVKVCRANHVSKLKKPDGTMDTEQIEAVPTTPIIKQEPLDDSITDTSLLSPAPPAVVPPASTTVLYIPQEAKVSDFPEIPQTGEWFCPWMNDFPVGDEAILEVGTSKLHTVIVADWRLPEGWVKHIYQRFTAFGKMDIILVNPEGRQFRSRQELKLYLAEKDLPYDGNVYDFGLHKRRAKDMGFTRYTKEYKDAFLPPPPPPEPLLLNTEVNIGSVKVKIIDNLFQCPEHDCLKTFRKENHLQIHIKHYHKELAKGLGEIPNMQDLAALRTPQVELIETPKPSPRRSHAATAQSSSKTSVKSEDAIKKEPEEDEKNRVERDADTDAKKSPSDLDPATKPEPADIKSPKPEASSPASTAEGGATAAAAPSTGFDPEEAIESHAVTKQPAATTSAVAVAVGPTVKSTTAAAAAPKIKLFSKKKKKKSGGSGTKKTKGGFVSKRGAVPAGLVGARKSKKKKKVGVGAGRSSLDYMDAVAEETRHSFANDSFFRHGYGYDPEASQTMTTNASICGQYGDDSINAAVNSPRFINENGEMIKIVSMKKEEIINCLCGYGEEDGLMVQCELCLCWQHGICNGFERDTQVPDKYVCYICRHPAGGRESRRYIHDQDWLYEGKLPVANYHVANAQKNAARFDILKQSHTLGGNLLELKRFMHSLKVKINIAERKDHPKMYLWSKKWEKSPPRGGNGDLSGIVPLNSSLTGATPSAAAQSTGALPSRTEQQRPVPIPHIPVPEAAIDPAECQAILLEHIQKQQNAAMARLQAIEAQIIALEAYDDKSELLESPTAKNYPKTKQTIHMLLNDLTKMKKIAAIHRSAQQPPPY